MTQNRRTAILDLHGRSRYKAVQELNDILDECSEPKLLVITGRGRHSPNGRPVIKPLVDAFLNRNGYWHRWHEFPASGAVTLQLADPEPSR